MPVIWLLACSGEIYSVDPDRGSARGGQEVRVSGKRLDAEVGLYFGEAQAEVAQAGNELLATVPPGLAGWVDLSLDRGAGLEEGYLYEALELTFTQAAPHYLPDSTGLAQGVVATLNDDAAQDAAVLRADGVVELWLASGTGSMSAETPVLGPSSALHATDLNGDGIDEVIVGARTGEWPRVVGGSFLPWAGGPVASIGSADLNQDSLPELLFIEPGVGLRVLWNASEGEDIRMRVVRPETELLAGTCPTVLPLGAGSADCAVAPKDEGFAGELVITGEGATLSTPLPVVGRVPDRIRWAQARRSGGAQITPTLVDSEGTRLSGEPLALDSEDWETVSVDVSTWAGWELLQEPLTLELRIDAVDSVSMGVDTLGVDYPDGGASGLSNFEQWPPLYAVASESGPPRGADFDADGDVDLAMATAGGILVLETVGEAAWAPVAAGQVPETCASTALTWVGQDIAVACPGQDRLLRNDGSGYFFDDTASAMPLDDASGADIAAADLDLDGVLDLLIATDRVDRLYLGAGSGFVDQSPLLGLESQSSAALLPLDVDGDGDLDILRLGEAGAQLFVSTDAE